MADRTDALAKFCTVVKRATASAAVASITVTGVAGQRFAVARFGISWSSAVSAAVLFEVSNGTAYLETLRIPAAAITPIFHDYGGHPVRSDVSTDLVFNLPNLGAGVLADLVVHGFYTTE
mgnify:FL=1